MHFPSDILERTKDQFAQLYASVQQQWGTPALDPMLETVLMERTSLSPQVQNELQTAYIVHKDHFSFPPV